MPKNVLATILIALGIILIFFSLFIKTSEPVVKNSLITPTPTLEVNTSAPISYPKQTTGKVSDEAASIVKSPVASTQVLAVNTITSGHSSIGIEKSLENQKQIEATNTWQATDYKPGDVISHTYTVQTGDTLWEIAEGYYGNGSQWTTILNANSSKIGFLPNGEQALIYGGQVLELP